MAEHKRQRRKKRTIIKVSDELTPRQLDFLGWYLDPDSASYGNAYASAKRAGYSDEYSQTLTSRGLTWLSENVGSENVGPSPDDIIKNLWTEAQSAMKSGDRIKALEVLAKIKRMFTDGTTINNVIGLSLELRVSEMSDPELDNIIKRYLVNAVKRPNVIEGEIAS